MHRHRGATAWLVAACAVGSMADAGSARQDSTGRALPYIDDFIYDGRVAEWRARPVDRVFEREPGRPQALVWVGQVDGGLAVAAELRGLADETPALAVSVAGAAPPALPPLGWGHQFGFETLADSVPCAPEDLPFGEDECRVWVDRQLEHREQIRPLFERTWEIPLSGPATPREIRATEAFAALPDPTPVGALEPIGLPRALSRPLAGAPDGYGVEVLIPWSVFPPVPAPDLEAVRIAVAWADESSGDVEGAGAIEPFETTSGRPLARPLRHRVTPCEIGLVAVPLAGVDGTAPRRMSPHGLPLMIPDETGDLRRLIVIDNHASGYQYTPAPETLSPQAFETAFDVLDVGRGERLCAPVLALADASGRVSPLDWTHTGEERAPQPVGLGDLEVRRRPDGGLFILDGPKTWWSYYGSGQCGACPRVGIRVLHIDPSDGEIHAAFRYTNVAEPGARDFEIEVAPDWSEIAIFESLVTDWSADPVTPVWRVERHCLVETGRPAYESCGATDDVPAPPVRLRARYGNP
ncbi:MAG: hypothetical protein MJB57_13295 [Gemmatimonadetes bacterium]|nr:hypothetical protein [Gemmatimonadota bacterium]